MDNVIVILGSCLLVLGIILAILMITIIIKFRSTNFSNNNIKDISNNVTSSVNNDELIAVITAAVSMYYIAESGVVPMFRVKSIKKANRR